MLTLVLFRVYVDHLQADKALQPALMREHSQWGSTIPSNKIPSRSNTAVRYRWVQAAQTCMREGKWVCFGKRLLALCQYRITAPTRIPGSSGQTTCRISKFVHSMPVQVFPGRIVIFLISHRNCCLFNYALIQKTTRPLIVSVTHSILRMTVFLAKQAEPRFWVKATDPSDCKGLSLSPIQVLKLPVCLLDCSHPFFQHWRILFPSPYLGARRKIWPSLQLHWMFHGRNLFGTINVLEEEPRADVFCTITYYSRSLALDCTICSTVAQPEYFQPDEIFICDIKIYGSSKGAYLLQGSL